MSYKKTLSILLSVMSYFNAIDPSPAEQELVHILAIPPVSAFRVAPFVTPPPFSLVSAPLVTQGAIQTQMEEFPVEVRRRAQDLRRRTQDFIDRMRAVEIAEEQAQE